MDPSSSAVPEDSSSHITEPSTNSDVKEERILARRKRVRTKIEADKRAALGEEPQKVRLKRGCLKPTKTIKSHN